MQNFYAIAKNLTTALVLVVIWALSMQQAQAQCNNTSAFGSATAPTGTAVTTISSCSYQSEYSTINSVVAGNRYVLTASGVGTFITVRFGTPSGQFVAAGITPLQFTAPCAGTYYATGILPPPVARHLPVLSLLLPALPVALLLTNVPIPLLLVQLPHPPL